MNIFIFETGFTQFARVIQPKSSHPKLKHNGFTYGMHYKRKDNAEVWRCTSNTIDKKNRCKARVEAKLIDGYTMVCEIKSPKHTCPNSNDK